jgi:hypothetical protein
MARGPPVAGLTAERQRGSVPNEPAGGREEGRPPAGLAQLPQGATLRQLATTSLTVCVPVAP